MDSTTKQLYSTGGALPHRNTNPTKDNASSKNLTLRHSFPVPWYWGRIIMGLQMKEKQRITAQVAPRYQRGSKKDKQRILYEFIHLTGYHRKYAIHLLGTLCKKCFQIFR